MSAIARYSGAIRTPMSRDEIAQTPSPKSAIPQHWESHKLMISILLKIEIQFFCEFTSMGQILVIGLQTAAPLLYSELLQVAYAKVNY
jgi:hypothetical protein